MSANTQGQVSGSKLAITLVAMGGALMAFIDISIVNVALSDMRASFGTPLDQIGWVSTGYMMANIVVIPMTGWFQRRFGFRRYFAGSVLLFAAASALCGVAWNLPSLVVFRILQGLGGGAIIPTSQSLLFARYPKAEHGTAAGLFGLGAVTGPLLGPTIGGYLTSWSSWHWIFLVNVPIGLAVAFVASRVIEEPGFEAPREPVDVFGIILLATGMPALQYVLEEGNREGWMESRLVVFLAVVAVITLVTFVVHELETKNPVVDLRVFGNRTYAAGTVVNFLTGLALFGSTYLFSLFCGSVMRYSALDIGRVFLVAGVLQVFLMPVVGKLAPKVDGRWLLVLGIVIVAASQVVAGNLTSLAGFNDLVRPQIIRALGLSFIFIPVSVMALSDLGAAQRGNATGLFNLTRELGGSIGTAWMGMVLTNGIKLHDTAIGAHVTAFDPGVQEQLAAMASTVGTRAATAQLVPEALLQARVTNQAMVLSFDDGFRLAALAIFLGLIAVALMKRPKAGVVVTGAH
jgi:MFS transporter, DHA2 family, multidrug resistance protein